MDERGGGMIYLTRTTIAPDGTRTTDIAALDNTPLKRYEAQGFVPCSYEVYSAAWRAKSLAAHARLSPQPRRDLRERTSPRCPQRTLRQVSQSADGHRYCLVCKYEWDVRSV
jgi:hypothetical protein